MSNTLFEKIKLYKEKQEKYSKMLGSSMINSMSQRKKSQINGNLLSDFENLAQLAIQLVSIYDNPKEKIRQLEKIEFDYTDLKNDNISLFKQVLSLQDNIEEKIEKSKVVDLEKTKLQNENASLFEFFLSLQDSFEDELKQIDQFKIENLKINNDNKILFEQILSCQKNQNSDKNKIEELKSKNKELTEDNKNLFKELLSLQDKLNQNHINRPLQNSIIKNKIGAAELVKNSLSYKLGNHFIMGARQRNYRISIKHLLMSSLEFYAESINNELTEIENLTDYIDMDDAEKIKSHLSFAIGKTVLKNISSTKSMKKIPQELLEEFFVFRHKQRYLSK